MNQAVLKSDGGYVSIPTDSVVPDKHTSKIILLWAMSCRCGQQTPWVRADFVGFAAFFSAMIMSRLTQQDSWPYDWHIVAGQE